MISKPKEILHKIIYYITNFTSYPMESLTFLIPVIMYSISTISVIIGYILFIAQGRYTKQISYIKTFGIDGIIQGFTLGTSGILMNGNIPKTIGILSLVQFVVMLVTYFKTTEKTKRIFMIVDLIMIGLTIVLSILFSKILIKALQRVGQDEEIELFWGIRVDSTVFIVSYIALGIILFAAFFSLVIKSRCKEMFKDLMLCLVFHFILMPLLMLFLENIIPLVAGIAVLIMIGLFVLVAFSGSSESSGGTGTTPMPAINNKNTNEKSSGKEKKKSNENCMYITDYRKAGGIDLYKRHGALGDYVELDNHIVTKSICSVADAREGRFHLYDKSTGREIKIEEIPWKN